jgi:hypothetical protein
LRFYPFLLEFSHIEVIKANDIVEANTQEAIDHIFMLAFVANNGKFLAGEQ